jgi:hypothetical protein
MPVLGVGGKLLLKRDTPDATVLRPSDVDILSNSIYVGNPAFWSGDSVTLLSTNGLPIDAGSNGPDCPNGYATYATGKWYVGSNRSHILDNSYNFYKSSNSAQFYMREAETGITTSFTAFMYRDQLDRVSFYTSQAAALQGASANRILLYRVDFNELVISATSDTDYQNAVLQCLAVSGEYSFADVQDTVGPTSICDFAFQPGTPPTSSTEYASAYVSEAPAEQNTGWVFQGDLAGWSLTLRGPEVDTTAVGEKFGEAVKSVISGGGTLDFLVDRHTTAGSQDSTMLMQLLLLIEKGCKASAEFWMIDDFESSRPHGVLPGELYYTSDILITSSAINVRAEEVIAGSADFVTTGEIALRMGTN